jgi:anti-sigma B factor antagonist
MTGLTVTARDVASGILLELGGELDYHTAPQVIQTLKGVTLAAGRQLIVDLSALTFCDSSGIATLIAARGHAMKAGADIVLAAVPARVIRTLTIIGMARLITVHPTAQVAAEQWRSR